MRFPFPSIGRQWLVLIVLAAGLSLPARNAAAAGRKKRDPTIAVRFHAQTTASDPTFTAKVTAGNPPRELIIEKVPFVSERDIVSFYPYRAADGSYSATFQLDPHGRASLEEMSIEKRGMFVIAAVNGRPVTLLTVDKPIKDGILFIPGGLSEMDIRNLGQSFDITGKDYNLKKSKEQKADAAEAANTGLPKPLL